MFKCKDCGHLFEYGEGKKQREDYGEDFSVCPRCNGVFEEILPCQICLSYEHMETDSGLYCNDCIEKTQKKLRKIIFENFTKKEIEIIIDLCEGVTIWKI